MAITHTTMSCHIGLTEVGHFGKAKLLVGREPGALSYTVEDYGPAGLFISLLGRPFSIPARVWGDEEAKEKFPHLLLGAVSAPRLWIDWPDYGIPGLDRAWWHELLDYIEQDVEGNVVLFCHGGHGRTGTAASIMLELAGTDITPHKDVVAWLRAVYCDKVVESEAQLRYIEKITGAKLVSGPAKSYTTPITRYPLPATTVTPKATALTPITLSKNKWRRWWRKVAGKSGPFSHITRPADLPDGAAFEIDGRAWYWDAELKEFVPLSSTLG